MKMSALRAVLVLENSPPQEGWRRSRQGGLLGVCGKVTDHPVSPFGPATPPKEGNWTSTNLSGTYEMALRLLHSTRRDFRLAWGRGQVR